MLAKILAQYVQSNTTIPFSHELKNIKEIVSCVDHLPHAMNPVAELRSVLKRSVSDPMVLLNQNGDVISGEVIQCLLLTKTTEDICVAYETRDHIYVYVFPKDSIDHKLRHMGRRDTVKFLINLLEEKYSPLKTAEPTN